MVRTTEITTHVSGPTQSGKYAYYFMYCDVEVRKEDGIQVSRSDRCGDEIVRDNVYTSADYERFQNRMVDRAIPYSDEIYLNGKRVYFQTVPVPDTPGGCPRGKSYDAGLIVAFTRDCGVGYEAIGGLSNTKCVCTALSPEEIFEESPIEVQEFYEDYERQQEVDSEKGLQDIIKMLPMLIGVMVVVAIIGAFKR